MAYDQKKETIAVEIKTNVQTANFDKGMKHITDSVKKTTKEGSSLFADMLKADVVLDAASGIVGFFEDASSEALKTGTAVAVLTTTLKGLGQGKYTEGLVKEAENLRNKYGASVEEITKSQVALLNTGKVSANQLKTLTPLIEDYAKKTGKSFSEASDAIINGIEGRGKELKKDNINLDKNATASQNLASITAQLTKNYGGFADELANTDPAAEIDALEGSVANLKDQVGTELNKSFGDLAKKLKPFLDELIPKFVKLVGFLADKFSDLVSVLIPLISSTLKGLEVIIKSISNNFGLVTEIVETATVAFVAYQIAVNGAAIATKVLSSITEVYTGIQAALNLVMDANPIGLIIIAIAALVAGFEILYNKVKVFHDFILAVWQDVTDFFGFTSDQSRAADKAAADQAAKILKDKADQATKDKIAAEKAEQDKQDAIAKTVKESQDKQDKLDQKHKKKVKDQGAIDRKKKADETKKDDKDELKILEEQYKTRLNYVKEGSKEEYDLKTAQIDDEVGAYGKVYAKQLADLDKLHKDKKISEKDYQDQSLQLTTSYQLQLSELSKQSETLISEQKKKEKEESAKLLKDQQDNALAELEYEKSLIDDKKTTLEKAAEERLAIEQNEHDIKMQQLAAAEAAELASTELTEQQKAAIRQKYSLENKKNDKELADSQKHLSDVTKQVKLDEYKAVGDAASALSGLLGQQTAAGKALALSSALINTYLGITEALRQPSTLPSPFDVIAKVANVATVLSTGISAVKKITAVNVPGGKGGGGGGASLGGIPTSAPSSFSTLSNSQLSAIGNGSSQLSNGTDGPQKVFVTEADITRTQTKVAVIQQRAKIGH
jgi:hypothetical protein